MKLRVLTIAGVAIALALTAALVFSLRPRHLRATQAAEYRRQLLSEDPNIRLEAARALVQDNAADEEALLSKAAALLELDRYSEARKTLEGILRRKTAPPQRAVLIVADSYLDEAANLVAVGSPSTVDLTYSRVRELFADLDSTRQLLPQDKSAELAALLIQAHQADLSATLSRQAARPLAAEFALPPDRSAEVTLPDVDPVISDLVARRRQLESAVQRFCEQAILKDPNNADAHLLLVQMWLRTGRFDKAREEAERMIQLPHLERAVAGRVAGELMNLEENYGQCVLPGDIDLSVRLLTCPGLTGRLHTSFILAQAELALRQGRPEEADKLAAGILQTGPNAQASCQRARALVAQNKSEKAIELLLSLTEQSRRPATWGELGLAYLASARVREAQGQKDLVEDQVRQGRTMLRQALDLAPDLLPARLAIAQSLTASGNVDQARNDIAVAARINPLHPVVRSLQTQLLVQRTDLTGLEDLIVAAGSGDADRALQADDVALAGFMTLDDQAAVTRVVDQNLHDIAPAPMILIGHAWRGAEPWKRRLIATAVAQSLLDHFDADPLQRPLPPDGTDLNLSSLKGDQAEGAVDLHALTQSRFVPCPEETTVELLDSALELWPDNAVLLEQACALNLMLGRTAAAGRWIDRVPLAARSSLQRALAAFAHGDTEAVRREMAVGGVQPEAPAWLWLKLAVAVQAGDRSAVTREFTGALAGHPWFEPAVLLLIRDAIARKEIDQARAVLQALGKESQPLAIIAMARLDLTLGNPLEAFNRATAAEGLFPENISRRWYLADVRATADLALKRDQPAQDIFAGLAASWPRQRINLQWRWADLLCDWDQARRAADIVAGPLLENSLTPRQLDHLLARGALLMSGQQLGTLMDELLKFRKDQVLLLVYRARAYEKDGDLAGAEAAIERAWRINSQAPRVLMAKAHLERLQGRLPEATAIYEQLIKRGGRAGLAASIENDQLRGDQAGVGTAAAPGSKGPGGGR